MRPNLGYLLTDPEVDNFTYELANEQELVGWLSSSLGVESGRVAELLIEARSNRTLNERLGGMSAGRLSMKTQPALGRRLGWYVIVRIAQPERIIETGTHDGIGTLVLLSALERNAADGHPGCLVSIDCDPTSGWMVDQRENWTRLIGDSRRLLPQALEEAATQLFLHDSLHTYDHERFELEAAVAAMAGGLLISDNSHATTALRDVSDAVGARYAYWQERPLNHFYRGAGIGLAILPVRPRQGDTPTRTGP